MFEGPKQLQEEREFRNNSILRKAYEHVSSLPRDMADLLKKLK